MQRTPMFLVGWAPPTEAGWRWAVPTLHVTSAGPLRKGGSRCCHQIVANSCEQREPAWAPDWACGAGPPGLVRTAGTSPGARRTAAAAAGRRRRGQPSRSRTGQPDHRRLDLPGQSGSFRHPSIPRGLSRPVSPALEDLAARDSRYVRSPVRRVVRRPRNQGKVQRRPLPRLRRLARPRLARLVAARARGQPRPGPHPHDAQLGHPPRNGQPHLGDRHPNRPALSRAHGGLHGELGLGASASRPTSLATI